MLADNGPRRDRTPPKKKQQRPVNLGTQIANAVQPAVQKARQVDRSHPKYRERQAQEQARRLVQGGTNKARHSLTQQISRKRPITAADIRRLHGSGRLDGGGGGGLSIASIAGLAEAGINLPHTLGNLAPGVLRVPMRVAEATNPLGAIQSLVPGGRKIIGNAARDAVEIPGETIPSLYYGLSPLAHGDVKTAANRLVVEPYRELLKHPGRSLMEHPLGTVLMASGAEGALGRTAGRVGRSGVVGKRVQRATNLPRGSAKLPQTDISEPRYYSRDVFVQAAQKRADKRAIAKADAKRREAARIEDEHPKRAAELRIEANQADPRIISDKKRIGRPTVLERRADERVAANEGTRRLHRADVLRESDRITGRKAPAVLRVVAEGTVRANRDDLAAYVRELDTERASMQRAVKAGERGPEVKARIEQNKELADSLRRDLKRVDAGKLNLKDVKATAERYAGFRNQLDAHLDELGLLDKAAAERRRFLPAAVRNLGLKYEEGKGFVNDAGEVVKTEQIREVLAHPERVAEPAFLSQAPNARGGANYYRNGQRPATVGRDPYTGKAVTEGTYGTHADVYRESVARAQTLVDQQRGFGGMLKEFAAKHGNGKPIKVGTYSRAVDKATALRKAGSPVEWVPIRMKPFAGSKAQLAKLLEDTSIDPESVNRSVHGELEAAFKEALDGPRGNEQGPWTLIPKEVAERMHQHSRNLGPDALPSMWNKATSSFRRTVLATNPKWLAGNQLEATFRGAIKGALPVVTRAYYDGRKLIRELEKLDPVAAENLMERGIGQGHTGFAARQHIHRPLVGRSKPTRVAAAAAQTAPARALAHGWDRYTHAVFNNVNGRLERQFRVALAGKYTRDYLLPKNGLRLSRLAWEQAVEGMTNTNEQVALGRYVDRAYGKYDKFGPRERQFISLYTPFAAWTVNAVKFLTMVLPQDHPVLTAVLASASQSSEDWRKSQQLTQLGKDRLPGFLQNSIPGDNGSHLPIGKYTPFGFASDPGTTISSAFIPQASGVLAALRGEDFTGRPLKDDSTGGKLLAAAKEAGGALVPLVGTTERVAFGKGSLGQDARKAFDPFKFIQGKEKPKKSGGSHPNGGWGGSSSGSSSGNGGWG